MKKSKLELFKPFFNQTGYLSIVYNITDTKYHIINHNGSVYSLTKDDNEVNYTEAHVTIESFFDNFPKNKLHFDTKVIYDAIINNYFINNFAKNPEMENRVLLLLI